MISLVAAALLAFSPNNTPEQNSSEFDALQAALPTGSSANVDFACGVYKFARQIDIIRPISIRGAGGGPWAACTVFEFPTGVHGFYFHSHTTYTGSNSQQRANGASVTDIRVRATGQTAIRHAVVVKDPVRIERLYIEGWSGDGIHLNTGMPLSSASLTKVTDTAVVNGGTKNPVLAIERINGVVTVSTLLPHHFELDTIFWLHKHRADPFTWVGAFQIGAKGTISEIVDTNTFRFTESGPDAYQTGDGLDVRTGHGVYTHGGDSNSCEFRGIHVTGMKGYAIFEDSMLGNSYTKCMTDENEMGAYWGGGYQGNAANEFISCYSEQNQPHSYFGSPSIVIGGTHGATVLGRATFIGAGRTDEVVASVKNLSGQRVGSLQIGGSTTSYPSYLKLHHDGDAFPSELVLGNPTAQLGGWGGNWLAWKYQAGSGASFMLPLKGAKAPPGASRDVEPGGPLGLPKGFHGARGCHETEHYAVPQPHEGQNCDRRWHTSAMIGMPALYMKVGGAWRPVAFVQ